MQLITLDKSMLTDRLGRAGTTQMSAVEQGLGLVLGLRK
jgi:mRNA-degrading endonuclease toxin of MazEF toxin-antitoxin module